MNTCSTPLDLARQYFIWPGALMQSKGKKIKFTFSKSEMQVTSNLLLKRGVSGLEQREF